MADYTTSADVGAMTEIIASAMDEMSVTHEAIEHYTETASYQAVLKSKYQRFHFYYQPSYNADQWPEDLAQRPGKIHLTVNVIKPVVNIDARLQALIPRISLKPDGLSDPQRLKAEAAEKIMLNFLDMSDWEVWLGTLTRVKSLYGKGALKVFWNTAEKRPDVSVIENPANLRIGWGASDYSVMDWALYEYKISPQQALIKFPGIVFSPTRDGKNLQVVAHSDHADPLAQSQMLPTDPPQNRPVPYTPSQYEQKHVTVWDYWYKKPDGKGGFTVCNAVFVQQTLVQMAGAPGKIVEHTELPDLPYVVIPNDIEPGNPEGISTAEDLIDVQIELNRALAHWAQLVADETDPAWVAEGENANAIPPGTVPKAGEIVPVGDNKVHALDKAVNIFPVQELITTFWDHIHKVSGLSEILFGEMPGAQTSGRAVAIQVEAAANRLDPKRRLLYSGLHQLLVLWTIMSERVNPQFVIGADPDTGKPVKKGLKDVVGGFRRWKIVAPEITPRDEIENTQNEINKVNAGLSSLKTSMDATGVDSPEAELQLIREEFMDAQLHPEKVQTYTALLLQVQQLQASQQQMQQQLQQLPQGAGPTNPQGLPPGQALNPVMAGQAGAAAVQQQQFQAQPTLLNDQNQPQPMTQAGSPPPAAGQGPLQTQTLIRGGKPLNQIVLNG